MNEKMIKIKKNFIKQGITKELRSWDIENNETKNNELALGINYSDGSQNIWLGISLNNKDIKKLIKHLQKQIK